jgi:hypothetical protein
MLAFFKEIMMDKGLNKNWCGWTKFHPLSSAVGAVVYWPPLRGKADSDCVMLVFPIGYWGD